MDVIVGQQTPRIDVHEPYDLTKGNKAAKIAALVGYSLYPWQAYLLNLWLAVDANGKWVHPTCVTVVRRQMGKSRLLLLRCVYGLLVGEHIALTSHRFDNSRDMFLELVKLFDPVAHPEMAAYLSEEPKVSAGMFEIKTTTGGKLVAGTRAGFGRGRSKVDLVIVDEAQAYSAKEQADLEPTTTMSANPQVIMVGTPPAAGQPGEVLRPMRAKALLKQLKRACYSEWSAEPLPDNGHLDSVESYRQAAPSMGISNFTYDDMVAERSKYVESVFETECLGIFRQQTHDTVVPLDIFRELKDEASTPVGDLSIGIDMNRDRTKASVSIAGIREDGLPHIEMVAYTGMLLEDGSRLNGVNWIVDTVDKMTEQSEFKAVVIDKLNPAASLLDDFKRKHIKVTVSDFVDVLTGCAKFYDGVMNGSIRHLGQEALIVSLASAQKSPQRDAWKLTPSDSDSDITGIVSCVMALWASTTLKKTRRVRRAADPLGAVSVAPSTLNQAPLIM